MNGAEFLKLVADQVVAELTPNAAIRSLVTNSDVIGAFAEASVRSIVARVASPLRVCTGAVIDERACSDPGSVRQIDTIIWSPSPVPAVFAAGEFGLVPRGSVFGILEIKRSNYSDVGARLADRLVGDTQFELTAPIARTTWDQATLQMRDRHPLKPALGVICVRDQSRSDPTLEALVASGDVVVLLECTCGQPQVNPHAVHRLINFLALTRYRARQVEGRDLVNTELLTETA